MKTLLIQWISVVQEIKFLVKQHISKFLNQMKISNM